MVMMKSASRGLLCDQWGRMGWLSLLLPRLELQLDPPSAHTPDNCIHAPCWDGDTFIMYNMFMVTMMIQ